MNRIKIVAYNSYTQKDQLLDLEADTSIVIKESIKDISDPSTVGSTLSLSFDLPPTSTNIQFFRHYNDYRAVSNTNANSAFDARFSVPAKILLNGTEFRTGVLSLNMAKEYNGTIESFNVQFGSVIRDIKEIIGDDLLTSLDLSAYDHEYTESNVQSGLEGGWNGSVMTSFAGNYALRYPLISSDDFYEYGTLNWDTDGDTIADFSLANTIFHYPRSTSNNDLIGFDPTGTNYDGLPVYGAEPGINYRTLKPAISVVALLDAIEAKYGFDWERTFAPTPGQYNLPIHHLYMWCHRSEGAMKSAGGTQEIKLSYEDFNFRTGSGNHFFATDDGIIVDTGQEYYQVEFYVYPQTVSSTVDGQSFDWQIVNDNTGDVLASGSASGTSVISTQISYSDGVSVIKPALSISSDNDIYRFGINNTVFDNGSNTSGPTFRANVNYLRVERYELGVFQEAGEYGAQDDISGDAEYLFFSNVRLSNQMPKMKIMDFLKGLAQMFNLVIYYDKSTGKVTWDYWKDWVDSGVNTWYATGQHIKLDRSISVSPSKLFSRISFRFEQGKSFLNTERNARVDSTDDYGDLSYDVNRQNFTGTAEHKVKLPFEKMLFSNISDNQSGGDTNIVFGTSTDESNNPYVNKPVLMFIHRQTTTNGIRWNWGTGERNDNDGILNPNTGVTEINNYNAPCNANLNIGSDGSRQTINWDEEFNEVTLTTEPNGLFKTYWEEWINRVFNTQSRLLKVKAIFTPEFIANFQLNDIIVTSRGEFYINKISYDIRTLEGNLELIPKL